VAHDESLRQDICGVKIDVVEIRRLQNLDRVIVAVEEALHEQAV